MALDNARMMRHENRWICVRGQRGFKVLPTPVHFHSKNLYTTGQNDLSDRSQASWRHADGTAFQENLDRRTTVNRTRLITPQAFQDGAGKKWLVFEKEMGNFLVELFSVPERGSTQVVLWRPCGHRQTQGQRGHGEADMHQLKVKGKQEERLPDQAQQHCSWKSHSVRNSAAVTIADKPWIPKSNDWQHRWPLSLAWQWLTVITGTQGPGRGRERGGGTRGHRTTRTGCRTPLWPPDGTRLHPNLHPEPHSLNTERSVVSTKWGYFGSTGYCCSSQYYCSLSGLCTLFWIHVTNPGCNASPWRGACSH